MLFASVQPSSLWFCADLSIMLLRIPDLVPAENFVSLCQKMVNLENLLEVNQSTQSHIYFIFRTASWYPSLKD